MNERKDMTEQEISQKQRFTRMINKMQKQYDVVPQTLSENKIYIREEDFDNLSKYERNVIKTIANIYGIMNDPSKDVTFEVLHQAMASLGKNKTDSKFFNFKDRRKKLFVRNIFPRKS
jgi:hypothetical protein